MLDRLTEAVIAGKDTVGNIANTMGSRYAEIIQERLNALGHAGNKCGEVRRIIMQGQRAQKEASAALIQELRAAGCELYSPGQGDYTAVVRVHLDGCESGEYPTATKTAQAIVGDKATKLLAKANRKRLRKAFQQNNEHPGMRRISAIADNSAVVAAASVSVSTCLGTLANSRKVARMLDEQRRRTEALEAELAAVRTEAAQANARLDLKDQGTDWKETARAVLAAERGVSNRELARRVGRDEKSIRKYLRDIKGGAAV